MSTEKSISIETGNRVSIDQIKNTFYLVMGSLCQCGKTKGRGNPFCNACMNTLSVDMRNRLYLMLRRTFVEAYIEATNTLPKAEPRPCACGCEGFAEFPWKFKAGHRIRKGDKQGQLKKQPTEDQVAG
jgi:hypothetical protein